MLSKARISNRMDAVRDGEEALNYLRGLGAYATPNMPDLILMDLNLPKKSGYELLHEIRKDEGLRYIPVVVLSGSDAPHDIKAAGDLNAADYVVKPLSADRFAEAISHIPGLRFSVVKMDTETLQ